ncbi:hypothetical protein CES85_0457 [Ochrobactrum quorumnocens]|uniref:Uncharacterized protein n=1 Tax=Ochrobactrum quorumnocens TaxID=271865 RepID=A0A248UEY7_9HYPH|nr:hypothetical protein CES85_0457 [[Ochrobactrum] quorumnocens]
MVVWKDEGPFQISKTADAGATNLADLQQATRMVTPSG